MDHLAYAAVLSASQVRLARLVQWCPILLAHACIRPENGQECHINRKTPDNSAEGFNEVRVVSISLEIAGSNLHQGNVFVGRRSAPF